MEGVVRVPPSLEGGQSLELPRAVDLTDPLVHIGAEVVHVDV